MLFSIKNVKKKTTFVVNKGEEVNVYIFILKKKATSMERERYDYICLYYKVTKEIHKRESFSFIYLLLFITQVISPIYRSYESVKIQIFVR